MINKVLRPSVVPRWLPAIAFALTLMAGCGGQKLRDGFADVEGTITLDGEPLPNAQVIIETERGSSFARTDARGHYVAEYSKTLKGAAPGAATVRISTKEVFPDEDVSQLKIDPRSGDHVKPELLPDKYNRKSELKIEILEGGGPYDFALQSK